MVSGFLLCPPHPWLAVGAQSLCLEGPEAQAMVTLKSVPPPDMEPQWKWPPPRDTPGFLQNLIFVRRPSCWVVLLPQERSQLMDFEGGSQVPSTWEESLTPATAGLGDKKSAGAIVDP